MDNPVKKNRRHKSTSNPEIKGTARGGLDSGDKHSGEQPVWVWATETLLKHFGGAEI